MPNITRTPEDIILRAKGITAISKDFFTFRQPEVDDTAVISQLGTPVWSNLVFTGGSFFDLDGNQIFYPGLRIDTILFTIDQPKNIVKTPVQGRRGTVKEYISDGDFQILAEGVIVSEFQDQYPADDVNALVQIMKVPEKLRVISEFLQRFDIDDVVVDSFNMPQTKGTRDSQFFRIKFLSDDPDELVINDVRGSQIQSTE